MKKIFSLVAVAIMIGCLAGCGTSTLPENSEPSTISTTTSDSKKELKQGDTVSIVGQVASSTLVNGDTLWVQVKQDDESFVVYHCQLKDEFISKAEVLKLASSVKVKGLFMSTAKFEQENTATLITLYDCELVE